MDWLVATSADILSKIRSEGRLSLSVFHFIFISTNAQKWIPSHLHFPQLHSGNRNSIKNNTHTQSTYLISFSLALKDASDCCLDIFFFCCIFINCLRSYCCLSYSPVSKSWARMRQNMLKIYLRTLMAEMAAWFYSLNV